MSVTYDKANAKTARETAANASYVAAHVQAGRMEGAHAAHMAMGQPCRWGCPEPESTPGNRFDTEATRSLVGVPRQHHAAYRAMPIVRKDIPAIEPRAVRPPSVRRPMPPTPRRSAAPATPVDPAAAEAAKLRANCTDIRVAIVDVERRLDAKRCSLIELRHETHGTDHAIVARFYRGEKPPAETAAAITQLEAAIAHDEAVLAHLRGHR